MSGLVAAAAVTAGAAAWCRSAGRAVANRRLVDIAESRRPAEAAAVRLQPRGAIRPAVAVVAVLAVTVAAGPLAGILGAIAGIAAVRLRRRSAARHEDERQRQAAVALCSALASELRAGTAPVEGLAAATAVATGRCAELARQASSVAAFGGDVGEALRTAARSSGTTGGSAPDGSDPAIRVLRRLAACWQVSARTGAGLAASVDRLANAQRAEEQQRMAVSAQLAGPRATARLLAGLPVAGVAMAAALGASPAQVLLHTSWGAGCLVGGILLDVLGVAWTSRLSAGALPP